MKLLTLRIFYGTPGHTKENVILEKEAVIMRVRLIMLMVIVIFLGDLMLQFHRRMFQARQVNPYQVRILRKKNN